MNILPYIHFFNAIVYFYLASYILVRNSRLLINRVCVAFLSCFGIWSLSSSINQNIHISKDIIMACNNVGAIGWCSFAGIFLWFSLIFADKKRILKSKLTYVFILGAPLFFIYMQWSGRIIEDYVIKGFWWADIWADSVWVYLFYTYYALYMLIGLAVIYDFMRKTPSVIEKKQAKIILLCTIIPLFVGSVSDTILPKLGIHVIPNLASIFVIFWAVGLVYAIVKYRFLEVTPAIAADIIIANMTDMLIITDHDFKILLTNEAVVNTLGYTKEELKGKMLNILFFENSEKMDEVIKQKDIKHYDIILKRNDNKNVPVIFSVAEVRSKKEELIGFVCMAKDITIRKEMENVLKRSNEELEQFAYIASHDLQEPARMVSSYMDLINKRYRDKLDEKGVQFVDFAIDGALRMKRLINELLEYSRASTQKKKFEIVNCEKIVDQILMTLQEAIKESGAIVTRDLLPDILGDEAQLVRLLQNLLSNAIKFCKEKIPKIHISVKRQKSEYVFSVKDNGIGIKDKDKDEIFKIFQRLHLREEYEGTGIGLAVCKRIVNGHGGQIWVESEPGKGAEFYFTIPIPEL